MGEVATVGKRNYGLITSVEELARFVDVLATDTGSFGFDIETGYLGPDTEKYALHPETAILAGISFTNSEDWARYAPLGHEFAVNLDNYQAAEILWPLLSTGRGVAHNAGFELRHLAKWFRQQLSEHPLFGEQVRTARGYFKIKSDTQVEAYLAAELEKFGLKLLTCVMFDRTGRIVPQMQWANRVKRIADIQRITDSGERELAKAEFDGHWMTDLHELFTDLPKNRHKMLRFNVLDPTDPKVYEYACEDSVWCLKIHQHYYPRVVDMFLYKVEHGIVQDVVPDMEDFGVAYDWGYMRRGAEALRTFRDSFNAEIMTGLSQMVGSTVAIKLSSPKQVSDMLYGKLGMKTTVYTNTTRNLPPAQRKMSTGKIALAGLAKQYPVVKQILEWKEQTRLLGTYLEKYEQLYNYAEDGRTHPHHLSAVVITGRFAVADPPYQQCVPGSYQVLTPHGWERLDKVADGVPVAQYHSSGEMEFVVPEVVRNEYHGDMITFASAEGGTWRYTPNHRIIYRLRNGRGIRSLGEIKECTAQEWEAGLLSKYPLPQGRRYHDRYMVTAGARRGGVRLREDERNELALAIAVQADGTRTNGHQYDVALHRSRKVIRFNVLSEPLGVRLEPQSSERWRARLPVSAFDRWLDETKNFRPEAILELCADDLAWFVEEVMQWDGDATRGATYGQNVARRQSVEVVQAAAALSGHHTSIYERPSMNAVTVNVHPKPHKGAGWQDPMRLPSDGMVYCVTVPTGMFLCRNDEGKVLVTGNSPKEYHFDLAPAKAAHAEHAEAHGEDCDCHDMDPPPGTCFRFNFRDAIIAPDDHYILGFDLSQAELRAIAGEAGETSLLRAFQRGDDVHTLTAALMLGIAVDKVTKKERAIGKTMNFALLYGMSVQGLADRLGISKEEAQVLYDKYFAAFPAISVWMERQVYFGRTNGYVTSRFGRRLPIWEYASEKHWIRAKGDRACVNYPIQGAATGDYVKIAMIRARRALRHAGLHDKVRLFMNVHDALEFAVHRSVSPELVINVLQPAVIFGVDGWPAMKADWHIAKRWGSPHEITLGPDGKISIAGLKEVEFGPTVSDYEEDEESGELVPVMPDVDAEVVRRAAAIVAEAATQPAPPAAAPPAPVEAGDGRHIIVALRDMPDEDSYLRFCTMLEGLPGPNWLTLRTPEGDLPMELPAGTRLSPRDTAAVGMVLGPCDVFVDAADIDPAELTRGLTF